MACYNCIVQLPNYFSVLFPLRGYLQHFHLSLNIQQYFIVKVAEVLRF